MSSKIEIVPIETDVLIIGGGLAGCMAGIKAVEHGVKVIIAEKGNTENSGCAGTGIDHTWAYIPEVHKEMGYTIEDMIEDHTRGISGGLVNKELLYFVATQNYYRVLDMEKWGVKFRYEDSRAPGKFRIVPQFHSVPSTFNFDGRDIKLQLTRVAKKRGVQILNRVMMTDLISTDGQIAGALGVGVRDGKIYFFRAKAIVVSTGRNLRLSRSVTGVWGSHRLPIDETGDGKAMMLRAGVGILNMEFLTNMGYAIGNFEINLGAPRNTTQPAGSITGPNGEVFVPRTYFYDWGKLGKEKVNPAERRAEWLRERAAERPPFAALRKEGKGPFFLDLTNGTEEEIRYAEWSISNEGKGSYFLNYLAEQENFDFRRDKLEYLPVTREMAGTAASGAVVDNNMETNLKGLFAAGEDAGAVPWQCSAGAFAMGWQAGDMAAQRALKQSSLLPVSDEKLDPLVEICSNLLDNKDGYHWRQLELAVQNVVDYYCGDERTEAYLKRGLKRLSELESSTPLKAENPHELGRCLEVRSIIDNAEMVMRASLERKETRKAPFGFIRTEYPERDDENFLCFLNQQLVDGKIRFSKIPVK